MEMRELYHARHSQTGSRVLIIEVMFIPSTLFSWYEAGQLRPGSPSIKREIERNSASI